MKKLRPFEWPGGMVGLVAPAGPVSEHAIDRGLRTLEQQHIRYEPGRFLFSNRGLVAATVEERLQDFYEFLSREDVHAIWAARGGYGTIQLIDQVDYRHFAEHPKPFIGFSDVTTLQWALFQKIQLPSFSGFTLLSQFTPSNPYLQTGLEILIGQRLELTRHDFQEEVIVLQSGEATGTLIGGTLSIICSLLGTPYLVDAGDLILYIEDINEPLYRVDRMLHQLKLAGFFHRVQAVILGKFLYDDSLQDVHPLVEAVLPSRVPLIMNFPYGHLPASLLMPMGVPARLSTSPLRLQWESPYI
ncbi:MAG: LD-carboxypeptidase [Calditrichaeota bacterium]|nr:LD-carboxypeptidase [Calditrichota bacterium]